MIINNDIIFDFNMIIIYTNVRVHRFVRSSVRKVFDITYNVNMIIYIIRVYIINLRIIYIYIRILVY